MSRSFKHMAIAAALLFVSVISTGPALASDPFVSLKMSRLPAGSMVAPFELTALDGKVVKSSELKVTTSSSAPRRNAKSPMRLTTNAFLAASEADFFS